MSQKTIIYTFKYAIPIEETLESTGNPLEAMRSYGVAELVGVDVVDKDINAVADDLGKMSIVS